MLRPPCPSGLGDRDVRELPSPGCNVRRALYDLTGVPILVWVCPQALARCHRGHHGPANLEAARSSVLAGGL